MFLDCLKGFAIATVVLGHTFQNATPDFDHYLPFRIIYSFHMPMFLFVAGMTASVSFSQRLNTELTLWPYVSETWSRALRLLVPFVTWGTIPYFLGHPEGYNPATWILHVFQRPDSGLWFLLTVFQCGCILALVGITVQVVSARLATRRPAATSHSTVIWTLIVTGLLANVLIRSIPVSQTFLPKGYFIYFFAGVVFHLIRPAGISNAARWIPYVIFVALAPFWYRTEMSPVASFFWNPKLADSVYRDLVAFAGTLAFIDLVRMFVNNAAAPLGRAAAYVGKRSLDIYAIHFYFLAYFPPVIAPIVISLVVSLILRTNSVTSWLCFGQKPMNVWQIGRHRFFGQTPSRAGVTDTAAMTTRSDSA
jgi:fucose 4-O-acetylase-like acetyltransferase